MPEGRAHRSLLDPLHSLAQIDEKAAQIVLPAGLELRRAAPALARD